MNVTTLPTSFGRFVIGLLSLLCFALFSTQVSAQEVSLEECAGGTLFFVAYPDTVTNAQDYRYRDIRQGKFFLYIYSPVDQEITISRTNGGSVTKKVIGGEVLEFDTEEENVGVPLVSIRNSLQRNVLKVESKKSPIVVYAYMATRFGCAAFTPIPVESWGREYFSATWEADFVRDIHPAGESTFDASTKVPAPAEILVIAAFDNTEVTINPTGLLASCANCRTFTLNAGEAYLVQSYVDTNAGVENQADIAGSFITATKRIGVVSGNTRLWHEDFPQSTLGANSYKDLVAEWLAPTEQHGTKFVFMPTWDDRRQRPNADPFRTEEYVRVYATSNNQTKIRWYNSLGKFVPAQSTDIENGKFSHEQLGELSNAIPYETSKPGQAYQSPRPVIKFHGTTSNWAGDGGEFDSWGTYMVEMVPREQWISFSAFKAPPYPSSMKHYLNVVTDTNDKFNIFYRQGGSNQSEIFLFNQQKIPGTSLIWGQKEINAGKDYIIEAKNEARFGGFVYGSYKGYELYRPGGTKKDDDDNKDASVAGGGEDDLPEILHPSEYEEETAWMYGFPLAPSRCVLAPADRYDVKVEQDCEEMIITIESQNENPSGIKFIRLVDDRDTTFNTRLEFIDPKSALELREKNVANAEIRLVAIDPLKDARGVVQFRDRTRESQIQRIEFEYEAERVDIVPAEGIDFGSLTIDFPADAEEVTITNPLNKDVVVKKLGFSFGNQEFEITRVDPADFDWKSGNDSIVLKSGESIKVWIGITPKDENHIYLNSLRVELGCVEISIPLRAATAKPCIFVDDLDFGTLSPDEEKTLPLNICNNGKGYIEFRDPLLTWLSKEFNVSQDEIDKLRGVQLGADKCVEIMVTFVSSQKGTFRTISKFSSTSPAIEGDNCRDASVWTANVVDPGPRISGYDWEKRWLSSGNPCTKNDLAQYEWDIEVWNNGSAEFEVDSLVIVKDPDGVFEIIDPGNVKPLKRIKPGDINREEVRVAFRPMEEKTYGPAEIRVYIKNNDSVQYVSGSLRGSGIESYVKITDQAFERIQFRGPGVNTSSKTVSLVALGSRDVNIDRISINPDTDFRINREWLERNPWAEADDGLEETLAPDEVISIDIDFIPQSANPLQKAATIDVIGDFAYDVCSESDSSGDLTGEVFTLGAAISEQSFQNILTCYEDNGFVTVTNTGTDPIEITNISIRQEQSTNRGITLGEIVLPINLPGGKSQDIPVHFAPELPGYYEAEVTVTVTDMDGDGMDENLVTEVTGSARKITITFSIPDSDPVFPGQPLTISVNMEGENPPNEPVQGRITRFSVQVYYDKGMMLVDGENFRLGEQFLGRGWTIKKTRREPGYIIFEIENTAGNYINILQGEVLQIDFITFIGDATETELRPEVWLTPGGYGANNSINKCIEFQTIPGSARLDAVCGLNFRLIEATVSKYSAGNAYPNVARTTTDIEFSLGLDAHTTVEVFNQQGDKVGILVDEYLNPGLYRVTWDVRGLPAGSYYYRITSGHWTGTREVRVQK